MVVLLVTKRYIVNGVFMPLPLKEVIEIIIDNTRKRGSPVPIPVEDVVGWAEGLNLPRGGSVVIYTGLLYQMIPYIDSFVKHLEDLEKSSVAPVLMKVGRVVGRVIDLSKIIRVPREEIKKQHDVIRNIARLLIKAGVNFGYLYEDDMYSGALLYDLGLDDVFLEHATKVHQIFKKYGVREIITIDPHTTHIMRSIYPKYIEDFDIKVINYLEILYDKKLNCRSLEIDVTIHDPCIYSRYENIIDQPRKLLSNIGVKIIEPSRTKKMTFCCGGPIESLSPSLSKNIARIRMEELSTLSKRIVVMCPICYLSLSRVKTDDIDLRDISDYLARGCL